MKISLVVRDQAARIFSIAACKHDGFSDYEDIAQHLDFHKKAVELALATWCQTYVPSTRLSKRHRKVFAQSGTLATPKVKRRTIAQARQEWQMWEAECEARLRTGWSPREDRLR